MASAQSGATCSSTSTQAARLADQAATAALYVTHPERKIPTRDSAELETRNIRDSRITGTSSPAFDQASAGAAASLAHAKSRPYKAWKPGKQPEAERAALHVQDFQIPEPQRPTRSSLEGSKAALLAVRDRRAITSLPPITTKAKDDISGDDHTGSWGWSSSQHEGALRAATGAYLSNRKRADSAPSEPVIPADASYALSAAGISHRARPESQEPLQHVDSSLEASRIHNIANANAQLYTATPPVSIEVEEQNKRNMLRAAAISMAQDMYAPSRVRDEQGPSAAIRAAQMGHYRARSQRSITTIDESVVRRAVNLQDAAQKLAAEKLARMQDENEAYQSYYGTSPPTRSRLSVRRKRTASETDASKIDMERSMEIRNQMSSLRSKLNEVDEQRQKDREQLMQAARRNVDAAIHDMELRVYNDTGRPSPAMQKEWEEKARERALLETESQLVNGDRINIGADRYMDRAEVEAIARSRVQPTLDQITSRAEEHKAKELEQRLDEEEQKRRDAVNRQREAELREEERRQEAAEKQEGKEEKLRLWRRKSKRSQGTEFIVGKDQAAETTEGDSEGIARHDVQPEATRSQEVQPDTFVVTGAAVDVSPTETTAKSESRFRSWFKDRIGRRSSGPPRDSTGVQDGEGDATIGFTGGAALTGRNNDTRGAALSSHPVTGSDLAQMQNGNRTRNGSVAESYVTSDQPSTKGRSSQNGEGRRSRFRTSLMKMVSKNQEEPKSNGVSGNGDNSRRNSEAVEQASSPDTHRSQKLEREDLRDSAVEQGLPVPPAIGDRGSTSTARESRFSEDL